MTKIHHFFPIIIIPLLLTTASATPLRLQARDYSSGAIAQSTWSDENANCTSYLYYGESTEKNNGGTIQSCWSAALYCASIHRRHMAYFVVGNAGYAWNSFPTKYTIEPTLDLQDVGRDMRGDNEWICRSGADAYGQLSISTNLFDI